MLLHGRQICAGQYEYGGIYQDFADIIQWNLHIQIHILEKVGTVVF